jgi:hypothetical protein
MQLFLALFGRWLQFHYQCFDRVVINGYLRVFFQEGSVVNFFREVCGVKRITKEVLRARTDDYNRWVASYAANHGVPLVWAVKGERKEEVVRPFLGRRKRSAAFGLYYVMMSQERGPSFRISAPKFPTSDPDHMILRSQRSLYRHYYFYIYDEIIGAMLLRVGSFFPFAVTVYVNGHEFIARQMENRGIAFTQPDNCFTAVGDRDALQAAAEAFTPKTIQERIDYWTFHLGPKFSKRERKACGGLHRFWSMQQIEYCRNFVFKRNRPIRRLFERACELSLYLLSADRIGQIFAQPVRRRVKGKLATVLERLDEGMHVYRAYWKHSFMKAYEKCRTFLRLEIVCNDLRDFGIAKALCHLPEVATKFAGMLDRFAHAKAEHLNVHGHLDLIAEIARPVARAKGRVAGLKLENTRIMRLLEVLLRRAGGGFGAWRTETLRAAILNHFELKPNQYTLNQIRYDLRKLAAHGIIERIEHTYSYRLSARGQKTSILLTLFARRIYGPVASSALHHRPEPEHAPPSPFEAAYRKVDESLDALQLLLAA